jgi:hypothetical protein
MIKTSILLSSVGAVVAMTLLSTAAYAASATYVFSVSNTSSFADMSVATLNITDLSNGRTSWTLLANYDQAKYGNAFLNSLAYTYTPTVTAANMKNNGNKNGKDSLAASSFNVLSGQVKAKDIGTSSASFQTKNDTYRFTSGEKVTWTFDNTRLSQFSNLYVHMNAIDNANSVKFSVSPVPEPDTYAMMLLGLSVVGFAVRKKTRAENATQ